MGVKKTENLTEYILHFAFNIVPNLSRQRV